MVTNRSSHLRICAMTKRSLHETIPRKSPYRRMKSENFLPRFHIWLMRKWVRGDSPYLLTHGDEQSPKCEIERIIYIMTDNTNPKLLVSKADAIVAIHKQIQIGKNMLKRQLSDQQEFDTLKNDTTKWTDFNKTLFNTLFFPSPLPDNHGERVIRITRRILREEIAGHERDISGWITELESIYEQLDLYEIPINILQPVNKDTMNNENKKYFIGHGSSSEWLKLKDFLENTLKLPYEEFNRIPQAGNTTSNRLKEMLESCCMAFLVMTGEDEHTDGTRHARSNVIHEIGLFQAQLGYERAIILLEEGCEIFSNIHGITYIRFPKGNIRAAFEDIRDVLKRESILEPDRESISEQERRQDINHSTNSEQIRSQNTNHVTNTDHNLREYWSEFKEYCDNHGMSLEYVTWNQNIEYEEFRLSIKSISDSKIWLATWRDPQNRRIAVNLHFRMGESEDIFDVLMEERKNIEKVFGQSLEWQIKPIYSTPGPLVGVYEDITPDRVDWQRQFNWMFATLEKLNQTFRPFILKRLNRSRLSD